MKSSFLPAFGLAALLYFWAFALPGETFDNFDSSKEAFHSTVADHSSEVEFGLELSNSTMMSLSATASVVSDVSCNGGSDGSALAEPTDGFLPYTFLWDNGETTALATGLDVGLHFGTVTDVTMATATFGVVISQPTPIVVSAINLFPSNCNESNGVAQVSVNGGTPGYSFAWSNGQTSNPAFDFPPGMHDLTVTDANNCDLVWDFTIGENNSLQISSTLVLVEPDCNTNNGSASVVVVNGSPPYQYLWDSGATTSTATNLGEGLRIGTITDASTCQITFDVFLSNNSTLQISTTNILVEPSCNANNGVASVTWLGGTPPFSFLWDTGETTNPAFLLGDGLHTGTITDANTCEVEFGVTLTEVNTLQISTTNILVEPTCNSNNGVASITWLGGTAPFTFLWDTGETTNPAFLLGDGLHTGTITDANTCTATFDVTLTENNTLAISTTNVLAHPTCNSDNGVASVTWLGGTPPFSFLWDTGETTNPAFTLGDGLHTGTITDANTCEITFDVTLTETNTLAISSTNVLAPPSCNSNNGVASVAWLGGTPPFSFLWDTGETTNPAFTLDDGFHTGTITDANTCEIVFGVVITEDNTLSVSTTTVLMPAECLGANGSASVTIIGGTPAYTYLWDNGETTNPATQLTAGFHDATVTDSESCEILFSVFITENNTFSASATFNSNTICSDSSDGSATATANNGTGPFTYEWDNGETTQTAVGLAQGLHVVTITDANMCTDTDDVFISAPPFLNVTAFPDGEILCDDLPNKEASAFVFGGVPPYSYLWDNGQTTASASGLSNGIHFVSVTDLEGCEKIASVDIGSGCPPVHRTTTDDCIPANSILSFGTGTWQNIFFNNELIASINDNFNFLGQVQVEFFINTGPIRVDDNPFIPMEYMDRNFNITTEAPPNTPVTVRLYYTAEELTKYFLANDGDNNDISAINAHTEITFTKYSGSNEDCMLEGNDGVASGGIHELFPISNITHGTFSGDYYLEFDINSFSEFYLHGNSPKPLPIELISFTGNAERTGNLLEWSTAVEINTGNYEIQRSEDGINFETIGTLPAAGNSETTLNYEFVDLNPLERSYYRLAVVDISGEINYTNIIVIDRSPRDSGMSIVPNPSTGQITIDLISDIETTQTFKIYTATGKQVFEKSVEAVPGLNQYEFDLNNLSSGMYIIERSDANTKSSEKLILID
ncbi:MAG: T9SS type A sorting domain-containing protein [Bacteroidota bacterium]